MNRKTMIIFLYYHILISGILTCTCPELHRLVLTWRVSPPPFCFPQIDIVNKYLRDLMDGLSAEMFRTYNAPITLQQQLKELTDSDGTVAEKILAYNRANRAVMIPFNPEMLEKSMQNLRSKIEQKEFQIKKAKKVLKWEIAAYDSDAAESGSLFKEQLKKLSLQATDKENKHIALKTSMLNYLDPIPIEEIYEKTQREKFAWAIDMTDEGFEF
uniref:DNA topoisomerase n=1 Tax=Erpetoichthys calabaricus TaxID=27687 RepID=A0A8C4T0G9_ERPCA